MDQSVEKGAVGEDNGFTWDFDSHTRLDTYHPSVFDDKFADHLLPEINIGRLLQHQAPLFGKAHTVTLRARAPHSRTLGTVEHSKLDHRFVCDDPRIPAHGIDLSDKLPFGDTTHGWIA